MHTSPKPPKNPPYPWHNLLLTWKDMIQKSSEQKALPSSVKPGEFQRLVTLLVVSCPLRWAEKLSSNRTGRYHHEEFALDCLDFSPVCCLWKQPFWMERSLLWTFWLIPLAAKPYDLSPWDKPVRRAPMWRLLTFLRWRLLDDCQDGAQGRERSYLSQYVAHTLLVIPFTGSIRDWQTELQVQ